jgi:acetoin:2,6-dichlorophenolindophenol oxidoreductase subunit alpha
MKESRPALQKVELELYRVMYRIRRFEQTVLEHFPSGVFMGTTHTYLGQEANAAGVLSQIRAGDIVFSSHRCHGHYLAYGGEMRALFAELMGRATGVCGGRGGSQHLQWENFYSNGVQGGIVPLATGMALAEKIKGSEALAVAFLGDGTLGEGIVYEALNIAVLWGAPLLYVLENNGIAQTTPAEMAVAGDMKSRFSSFGVPAEELDSSDVSQIRALAGELLAEVRQQLAPRALLLNTCRFGPHSKGDDTRPSSEIERLWRERDPLLIHAARLERKEKERVEAEIEAELEAAFQQALRDPWPEPDI